LKRFLLCGFFCVLAVSLACAQEEGAGKAKSGLFNRFWNGFTETLFTPQIHKPFSVSGGIELTQNDRKDLLPEFFATADYELSRYFGFGARAGLTFASNQPIDKMVTVMEGVGFARFYLYDFGWIRPYLQTGLGLSIDREQDYEYTDILGEAALGARAHWTGWFLEANFRYGYPFRFAFGLSFGHSFLP
jgi:hypothetical protein